MYKCDTNPKYGYSHDLLCRMCFMRENEIDRTFCILVYREKPDYIANVS